VQIRKAGYLSLKVLQAPAISSTATEIFTGQQWTKMKNLSIFDNR
jgi:hypothetical protein